MNTYYIRVNTPADAKALFRGLKGLSCIGLNNSHLKSYSLGQESYTYGLYAVDVSKDLDVRYMGGTNIDITETISIKEFLNKFERTEIL